MRKERLCLGRQVQNASRRNSGGIFLHNECGFLLPHPDSKTHPSPSHHPTSPNHQPGHDISIKTVEGITDSLSGAADDFQKSLDKLVDDIQSDVLGQAIPDVPKVDFSDVLGSLRDF